MAQSTASGSRSVDSNRRASSNTYESVIEGYEHVELIGKGSFGSIRKVKRKSDGKLFARKELNYDRMPERDRKQLVSEVNILRTLDHKNIVKYEERYADTEANMLYIVMEYCEGGDLGAVIKKCRRNNQRLPEDTVWAYFAQLVNALDGCHNGMPVSGQAGGMTSPILHRDIKPENVFLDHEDNVKVGDFGLSKQLGAAQAFASTYVGTPYYMSPELAAGAAYDVKSDIWALGCVVYELCALAPPFDASSQAELTIKIKSGQVPSLPRGYSKDLGDAIRSMLELNPRKRPHTKQLLQVKQINLTLTALDLVEHSRTLKIKEAELAAREESLAEREAAINRRSTYNNFSTDHLEEELRQRQQVLEQAEAELRAREAQWQQRNTELDRAANELQVRQQDFEGLVERDVKRLLAAERESKSSLTASAARTSRLARKSDGSTPRTSQTMIAGPSPARPAPSRPPAVRRISDHDASMEGSRRLSRLPTSSSLAQISQARRRKGSQVPPSSSTREGRASPTDDEWIDTPLDGSSIGTPSVAQPAETLPRPVLRNSHSAPVVDAARQRRETLTSIPPVPPIPSAHSPRKFQPTPRKSAPNARVAQLIGTRGGVGDSSVADKSDATMKDITMDEKENESANASAMTWSPFKLQQRRERRITMEQQRAQYKELDQTEAKQHLPLATSQQDGDLSKSEGRARGRVAASQQRFILAEAPIYDISNDPDLPSPFLRKPSKSLSSAASRSINKTRPVFTERPALPRAATGSAEAIVGTSTVRTRPATEVRKSLGDVKKSSQGISGTTTSASRKINFPTSGSSRTLTSRVTALDKPRTSTIGSLPAKSSSGTGNGPRRQSFVSGAGEFGERA